MGVVFEFFPYCTDFIFIEITGGCFPLIYVRSCKCFAAIYLRLLDRKDSPASFSPNRENKSANKIERRQPMCKKRLTDISYPPVLRINRWKFSHFSIRWEEPQKNSKNLLRLLTRPRMMHHIKKAWSISLDCPFNTLMFAQQKASVSTFEAHKMKKILIVERSSMYRKSAINWNIKWGRGFSAVIK